MVDATCHGSDGLPTQGSDEGWGGAASGRAVTELTVIVISPRIHRAIISQSERMEIARTHLFKRSLNLPLKSNFRAADTWAGGGG